MKTFGKWQRWDSEARHALWKKFRMMNNACMQTSLRLRIDQPSFELSSMLIFSPMYMRLICKSIEM